MIENSDGRKTDRKALEAIRIRAVHQADAGESPKAVIEATLAMIRELIIRDFKIKISEVRVEFML